MKNIINKWMLIASIILFTSCDQSTALGLNFETGHIKVNYHDQILDAETMSPLEDVTVTWYVEGQANSSTTDENGYFYLENMLLGEYYFTYSLDGFVSTARTVIINPDITNNYTDVKQLGTEDYLYSYSSKTHLYQPKYQFHTKLMMDFGNNQLVPASNISYSISVINSGSIDYGYIEYSGETESDGSISILDSLPDVDFLLIAKIEHGGVLHQFNETITPSNISSMYIGSKTHLPSSLHLVNTNTLTTLGEVVIDYDSTKAITFTYNEPIDTDLYKATLYNLGTVSELTINQPVWSNDNKTVTITPVDTLTKNSYSVSLSEITSTLGNKLSETAYLFHIGGINPAAVGPVQNITFDYSLYEYRYYNRIRWTNDPNIDEYKLEIEIVLDGGTNSQGYRLMTTTTSTSFWHYYYNYGSPTYPFREDPANYINYKFTGYKNGLPLTIHVEKFGPLN